MVIELSSNDKVNSFFDGLIKSRFIEIFGDPICNDKNWNVFSLDTYCTITTGNTPSRSKKEYYGGDLEWIKSDNITSESIVTSAAECLSKDGEEVARVVGPNSILMVCIAGSLQRIGDVALTDRRVSFNQQINAIYSDSYNPRFLLELFKITKPILQQEIGMALKGMLSKSKLSSLEYIFPPIELQNQFADFVRQVDRTKSIFQQIASQYDELVKSRFNELIHLNPHLYELGDLISIYSTQRCDNDVYPILSITKEDGVVLQNEKFKKRIASIDVSSYKIVPRGKLIQGIHIDERNFAIQDLVDYGVVSPAYKVYSIKEELVEPVVLEYYLRSNEANAYIRNKFRGSIKRRESITKEDLFKMPILLPELSVQSEIVKFVVQVDKSKARLFDNLINSLQVSTY